MTITTVIENQNIITALEYDINALILQAEKAEKECDLYERDIVLAQADTLINTKTALINGTAPLGLLASLTFKVTEKNRLSSQHKGEKRALRCFTTILTQVHTTE